MVIALFDPEFKSFLFFLLTFVVFLGFDSLLLFGFLLSFELSANGLVIYQLSNQFFFLML